jgi:antitoxin ParD1/3/4
MHLTLRPEIQKLIDDQVASGNYPTREDAVAAGMASLRQQERMGDFTPGELEKLLAVADEEIERGEVLDGEEVFRQLRSRGKDRQGNAQ